MDERRRTRTWALGIPLATLAAAGCLVLRGESAWAQRARVTPNDIRNIIAAPGVPSPEDSQLVTGFVTEHIFGPMKKPPRLEDLAVLRSRYGVIVANAPKTPAHDALNRLAMAEMSGILRGDYPPPVKYNAMLLIANLNESDSRAAGIKPLPEAFPILLIALGLNRPELDYYKPAALIGLARWAEAGAIPADKKAEVTQKLLELVNQKDPPSGRSASAHNYLRRGAAKTLAAMGDVGPNNSVLNALAAITADSSARPTLRCEVAKYLAELKLTPNSNVDVKQLANTLGHQAVEICQQELDRSGGENRPPSRRMIMYALDSSSTALQKLLGLAERGSPERDFVYPLKNKIDALYNAIGDPDETSDDKVAGIVETHLPDITSLLIDKPAAPAAAPASAPSDAAAPLAAASAQEEPKPARAN